MSPFIGVYNERGMFSAMGACVICGRVFEFNPTRVPSVLIDPVTNLPPDQGGDPARAAREPICSECIPLVNAKRSERGMPEIEVLAGAYEAAEDIQDD